MDRQEPDRGVDISKRDGRTDVANYKGPTRLRTVSFCQGSFVMEMRNSYICAVSKVLDDVRNPAGLTLTNSHCLAL